MQDSVSPFEKKVIENLAAPKTAGPKSENRSQLPGRPAVCSVR